MFLDFDFGFSMFDLNFAFGCTLFGCLCCYFGFLSLFFGLTPFSFFVLVQLFGFNKAHLLFLTLPLVNLHLGLP